VGSGRDQTLSDSIDPAVLIEQVGASLGEEGVDSSRDVELLAYNIGSIPLHIILSMHPEVFKNVLFCPKFRPPTDNTLYDIFRLRLVTFPHEGCYLGLVDCTRLTNLRLWDYKAAVLRCYEEESLTEQSLVTIAHNLAVRLIAEVGRYRCPQIVCTVSTDSQQMCDLELRLREIVGSLVTEVVRDGPVEWNAAALTTTSIISALTVPEEDGNVPAIPQARIQQLRNYTFGMLICRFIVGEPCNTQMVESIAVEVGHMIRELYDPTLE
jgi:hypothetical protein